jgi:hypothetical protein
MRTGISITLSPPDRKRLQALVNDRNCTQKHVWRAEIVLLDADGVGANEIMRRTSKSKYVRLALAGALHKGRLRWPPARHDARPSRIPPFGTDIAKKIVALTLQYPPGEATYWAGATMAKVRSESPLTCLRRARPPECRRCRH